MATSPTHTGISVWTARTVSGLQLERCNLFKIQQSFFSADVNCKPQQILLTIRANMWNRFAVNLSRLSVFQHVAPASEKSVLPLAVTYLRALSTSSISEGRTHYSFVRVPRSIGNIPIPSSLKDGTVRRHRGRSGRNDTGRIVIRHRGGGHSQTYRIVDFVRAPEIKKSEEPRTVKDKVFTYRL
ncbi:unnamed protein product [Porites lobata]|uniref:Large ribosomal subunit protein uL2 RNA-binding domain-containing protein n=1 Tax=Porites lobata TaxID=104759 RepID=A0ABN8P1T8_9CNID|nr:unnamed protein product [Porites lobata]